MGTAYQRVAEAVSADIKAGRWRTGEQISSEHDLMRRFGVSRNTVRHALGVLEKTNLVHRRQGKGTFVADQGVSHVLGGLRSFTELMRDLGLTPGIAEVEVTPDPEAPDDAVEFLPGSFLWRVQRVRTSDGAPFALMQSWLPDAIASRIGPEDLIAEQSLYRLLETRLGVRVGSATEVIRAEAASAQEAEVLNIETGAPLLTIYRWTLDRRGHPVEYVRSSSPGDRFHFVIKLEQ